MVTCVDKVGKPNIIILGWVGVVCSEPPMVGISIRPSRYSRSLIRDSKEFVVNIPTQELLFETDYCGMVSGKNVDKFKETKFNYERANQVSVPLISECLSIWNAN